MPRSALREVTAQQLDERRGLDRLAKQRRDTVTAQLAGTDVVAVAGVEDDGKRRPLGGQSLRELEAGHARHRLVGEDEVDAVRILAEPSHRLEGIGFHGDVETTAGEELGHELTDGRLVVDDEDTSGQPAAPCELASDGVPAAAGVGASVVVRRQEDAECLPRHWAPSPP